MCFHVSICRARPRLCRASLPSLLFRSNRSALSLQLFLQTSCVNTVRSNEEGIKPANFFFFFLECENAPQGLALVLPGKQRPNFQV